ncbi:MAG: glycosyltransferase family 2 protein [Muribaculaceae bacterium]
MPLISIIIPVYNAEKYLCECIDSILRQQIDNWEIILVNDGSTDKSGEICDRYASKFKSIKVIHQKNSGQAAARNVGLDNAKGEFITFIDADDMISREYFSCMLLDMGVHKADIASVDFTQNKDHILYREPGGWRLHIYSPKGAIKNLLYQQGLNSGVAGKLYLAEIFNGVRFVEGIIYEDLEIMPRIFEKAKRIIHLERDEYYYRKNSKSTLSVFSPKRFDVLDVVDNIYEKYKSTSLESAALDRKFSAYFNILMLIYKNGKSYPEVEKRCLDFIIATRKEELKNSEVRLKNKIGALFSYSSTSFLKFLAKIFFR